MMYGQYNDYWGTSMMGWFGGGIMMIVFWALLIALIVWIAREVSGQNNSRSSSKALEILKERYAKGEIDKKEFEDKKKDIV